MSDVASKRRFCKLMDINTQQFSLKPTCIVAVETLNVLFIFYKEEISNFHLAQQTNILERAYTFTYLHNILWMLIYFLCLCTGNINNNNVSSRLLAYVDAVWGGEWRFHHLKIRERVANVQARPTPNAHTHARTQENTFHFLRKKDPCKCCPIFSTFSMGCFRFFFFSFSAFLMWTCKFSIRPFLSCMLNRFIFLSLPQPAFLSKYLLFDDALHIPTLILSAALQCVPSPMSIFREWWKYRVFHHFRRGKLLKPPKEM